MKPAGSSLRGVMLACALAGAASLAAAQTPSPARLLVLLRNASTLAIVDPGSGQVLGRVPTVKDPHEVTTDGKLAFVCSQIEGLAIIDLAARRELRRFNPGPGSASHDVLYANGKVYFTAEGYKAIGRYDPVTNAIDWWLGTGQNGTHMLVFSRDMNTLFMPNTGSNSVSIAEGIQAGPPKWQVTSVPVPGPGPEGIALSPDGRELWVASRRDGSVSIIDVAGKKVDRDPHARTERRQSSEDDAGRPAGADPRWRNRHPGGARRGQPQGDGAGQAGAGVHRCRRLHDLARRLARLPRAQGRAPGRGAGYEDAHGDRRVPDGSEFGPGLHRLGGMSRRRGVAAQDEGVSPTVGIISTNARHPCSAAGRFPDNAAPHHSTGIRP